MYLLRNFYQPLSFRSNTMAQLSPIPTNIMKTGISSFISSLVEEFKVISKETLYKRTTNFDWLIPVLYPVLVVPYVLLYRVSLIS